MTRSKKNKQGRTRRGVRSRRGESTHPPMYVPTVSLSHKFRFINGANSGTFNVARSNLLNLLQLATTATTTVRLFQAVRLKKVEIWGNPVALGAAPTTVRLEWIGNNAPSTQVSDTGMGVLPAHVSSVPPANSSNRWWCISGTSESEDLFTLVLQPDCVIDVTLELRYVETETPVAGDIPAGASVGQLYGNYLDGIASGKLVMDDYLTLP
jgi:hypothetical protein